MLEDKIKELRQESNKAIAQRDLDGIMASYVQDIVVVSAEGGKLVGEEELSHAWGKILSSGGLLFARISEEIIVSSDKDRAWEKGRWRYTNGDEGGKYAAMWVATEGGWKIRSELFVGLE